MQLQTINADLDAEREERRNIRNVNTVVSVKQRNDFVEGKDLGALSRTVPTLTEEEEEEENEDSPKTKPDDTEHMKLYNKIMGYYVLLGKVVAMDIAYNWRWYKKILFWIAVIDLMFCWICMAYTIAMHIRNDDQVRILEPLALSGIAASVSRNILNERRIIFIQNSN